MTRCYTVPRKTPSRAGQVDAELENALQKEKLWREHQKRVLSIIPLDLDGYLFDDRWDRRGYASRIRSRHAADFTGWEEYPRKFEEQLERVVTALRSDPNARKNRNLRS